jgi:GH43 family beta-xylosidase
MRSRLSSSLVAIAAVLIAVACGGEETSEPPSLPAGSVGGTQDSSGGLAGGGAAGEMELGGQAGAVATGGSSAGEGSGEGGAASGEAGRAGEGGDAGAGAAAGGGAAGEAAAGGAGAQAGSGASAGNGGGAAGKAGGAGAAGKGGGAGSPAENPKTYTNPVLKKSGDPFCARFGAYYYLYLPDQLAGKKGGRVLVFRSKNLVEWEPRGEAYSNEDETRGGQHAVGLWAPEVAMKDGKFFLYYASVMSNPKDADVGDKDIVVVQGDSPEDFHGGKRTVLLDDAYAFIDPSPFVDSQSGKRYLYFKHRGALGTGSAIRVRPLASPVQFDGAATELFTSNDVPDALSIVEQPMVWREGDVFFLLYSRGQGDNATYQIAYATSKNALGPFTQRGVLFHSDPQPGQNTAQKVIAPGASSIVRDADKDTWIVYRQKTTPQDTFGDRFVAIDPVTFKPGVPTIEGHPSRGEARKSPTPIP